MSSLPAMDLSAKLHHYARLMRIDKPIGSLLLLWPTLWALWFAGGWPPLGLLLIFVVGASLSDTQARFARRARLVS